MALTAPGLNSSESNQLRELLGLPVPRPGGDDGDDPDYTPDPPKTRVADASGEVPVPPAQSAPLGALQIPPLAPFQIPGMPPSGPAGGEITPEQITTMLARLKGQAGAPGAPQPAPAPAGPGRPGVPAAATPQAPAGGVPPVPTLPGRSPLPQPPKPEYSDPLLTLGNPLTGLALFASAFTRRPIAAAMTALATAAHAQQSSDQTRFNNAYREYEGALQKAHTEQQDENEQYRRALENRRQTMTEKLANVRRIAAGQRDGVMNTMLDASANPWDVIETRLKAGKPISEALLKTQAMRELVQKHPGMSLAEANAEFERVKTEGRESGKAPTTGRLKGQAIKERTEELMRADPSLSWSKAEGMATAELDKKGSGGSAGEIGDFSLKGEDFLNSVPQEHRETVKAIAEGRMAVPAGRWSQQLRDAAFHYNPDLRGQTYGARSAGERYFAAGKGAENATAINTLIGHLGRLDSNIDGLKNSDFRLANKAFRLWANQSGDPRYAKVLDDIHAVASELGRVFKGTVTEGEIKRNMELVDSADSPETLHTSVREFVELMRSRLEGLESQYERSTGKPPADSDLLTPHSKDTLRRLETPKGGNKSLEDIWK